MEVIKMECDKCPIQEECPKIKEVFKKYSETANTCPLLIPIYQLYGQWITIEEFKKKGKWPI